MTFRLILRNKIMKKVVAMVNFHPVGIYHDMPEKECHADWSLSASGMKSLKVSPLNFWCNSQMNPDYEPKETEDLEEGKAWHKRILEGSDAFYSLYAPELDFSNYQDVLKSGDDLKEYCCSNDALGAWWKSLGADKQKALGKDFIDNLKKTAQDNELPI